MFKTVNNEMCILGSKCSISTKNIYFNLFTTAKQNHKKALQEKMIPVQFSHFCACSGFLQSALHYLEMLLPTFSTAVCRVISGFRIETCSMFLTQLTLQSYKLPCDTCSDPYRRSVFTSMPEKMTA